jgi:hypothetical protein
MSETLGPILALGTITVVNQSVFNDKPIDWRVPIATGLAAIGFGLAERVWPEGAVILAWTALLTVLITRTDPNVPSPTESAIAWFDKTGKGTT